jgi:AraC-like DNA-binding protein
VIRRCPGRKDGLIPSSAVRSFADPDDYAASIRAATARLTITGRGEFDGKLVRIDLHNLWMQRFSENLPCVWHLTNVARRAVVASRAQPGPNTLMDGKEIGQSDIVRLSDADYSVSRSPGRRSAGSMSLPVDVIAAVGAALVGRDLTPPRDAELITPDPLALARLKRLHETAGDLAEHAPAVIANPGAARGLEQALIGAMVGCIGAGEAHEDRTALRQHAIIMRRFHRVVEEHLDEPLYIPELCTEIGVSERTLRVCCQEQLGVSPKRFLLLRRMHLARRDLRESASKGTTVTEIATRYGFWQLGRFAGEYRALFGELPSAMLAYPPSRTGTG